MDTLLQLWGGISYLLNKAFFSIAENRKSGIRRVLRIIGWVVYILGVPAWVVILVIKHNWIAASIEAGGIPSMIFGLVSDIQKEKTSHRILDRTATGFTWAFIILGVTYSVLDFGGFKSPTQLLEIGVTVGFLMGSYLLAKKRRTGWLFFMLMNISMGILMTMQGKPLLAVQQSVSLCFVIYGFISSVTERSVSESA